METKTAWHTIQIQDLPPKKRPSKKNESQKFEHSKQKWLGKKCLHFLPSYYPNSLRTKEDCKCTILNYMQNVEVNTQLYSNPFYDAFIQAYNEHQELILSPDDVFMQITLEFSFYINNHAEEMRSMFVSHDGKKNLEVLTKEQSEFEWDEFFESMIKQIEKNTKKDVVDNMVCQFSTTGPIEKILSTAVIMDSFQKYFDYGRMIDGCGITNVHFLGTLLDWNHLLTKIQNLKKYAVTKEWTEYINGLIPVIENFIATYKGDVDVTWWNQITNFEFGSLGSSTTKYVSGWILKFFYGLPLQKVEVYDIKSRAINVPIKVFIFFLFHFQFSFSIGFFFFVF